MRFTDERDDLGILEVVVRILPAFGVGVLVSVLVAALYGWGIDFEPLTRWDPSTTVRLGVAAVGVASAIAAVLLRHRPFARALWLPTLIVPTMLLWDLGLIERDQWNDPQLIQIQLQLRAYAVEILWRATGGALPTFVAFLVASLRVGRPLPSPGGTVLLALGFSAAIGIAQWVVALGMQLILPGLAFVALFTYVPQAAFFDRTQPVVPRAIRALGTAPLGVLISVSTTVLAAASAYGVLGVIARLNGGTAFEAMIAPPTDPVAQFLSETVYATTHTSGALLLFAVWFARVAPSTSRTDPEDA